MTFNSLSKRSGLPGLAVRVRRRRSRLHRALRALPQRRLPASAAPHPACLGRCLVRRSACRARDGRSIAPISTWPTPCSRAATATGARKAASSSGSTWPAHGGGEAATKTLWKGCGVRLLPGTYLAREGASGANPGRNHVRVALVHAPRHHGRGLGAHRRHFGVGMASKRRTKERRRLLPGAVESGLRRILLRGYGLGIVAAACLAWASLATWSIYDPSFNNATQAAPRNVLGSLGRHRRRPRHAVPGACRDHPVSAAGGLGLAPGAPHRARAAARPPARSGRLP